MRKFFIVIGALALVGCGNMEKKKDAPAEKAEKQEANEQYHHLYSETAKSIAGYSTFGKRINPEHPLGSEEMYRKYQKLETGDTLEVKFAAKITEVCKKKGCFMRLSLPDGEETMVKFKDYAFFVPKDIEKGKAIVHGKAYVSMVSVDEQRHFAKDAGKSKEEIAAITQPKKTFMFMADGVLIEQ